VQSWVRLLSLAILASAGEAGFGCSQGVEKDRTQVAPNFNGPMATASPPAGELSFDHSVHAGKYGMQCLDCHPYADKSPVAGLPSERKCMGCHKFVAKDKPAVQLLAKRFEDGQSLRWTRVFIVPDYIYFSHQVHVRAKVDCKECHGDMAASKTIQQDQPFTMGRCLRCHEARGASRDCLTCHK
jgi:Cytochrome c7 and related cytochrome c